MNYLGVDNGVSGGIALVDAEGVLRFSCSMPIQKTRKGNEINVMELCRAIDQFHSQSRRWGDTNITVVIEEPGGSKSAKAATSMAGAFHATRALVEHMRFKLVRITPQQWQKPMLKCKTGDTKPVALQLASSLWPGADFKRTIACRTADMGIVDAALIAEWARRNNL